MRDIRNDLQERATLVGDSELPTPTLRKSFGNSRASGMQK